MELVYAGELIPSSDGFCFSVRCANCIDKESVVKWWRLSSELSSCAVRHGSEAVSFSPERAPERNVGGIVDVSVPHGMKQSVEVTCVSPDLISERTVEHIGVVRAPHTRVRSFLCPCRPGKRRACFFLRWSRLSAYLCSRS